MSFGLNNWNNNQQVRDRMENDALEYQMRETNPEQAKKDLDKANKDLEHCRKFNTTLQYEYNNLRKGLEKNDKNR